MQESPLAAYPLGEGDSYLVATWVNR
jgi:hypothetical protein